MPGFVQNVVPHFRRQLLQCQGQRYGFNGVNRKVNPAAVAGAPFGTGNLVPVPADDPLTAPVHLGDQFLIVLEGLQNYSSFCAVSTASSQMESTTNRATETGVRNGFIIPCQ
jgi:hypothetical protein